MWLKFNSSNISILQYENLLPILDTFEVKDIDYIPEVSRSHRSSLSSSDNGACGGLCDICGGVGGLPGHRCVLLLPPEYHCGVRAWRQAHGADTHLSVHGRRLHIRYHFAGKHTHTTWGSYPRQYPWPYASYPLSHYRLAHTYNMGLMLIHTCF